MKSLLMLVFPALLAAQNAPAPAPTPAPQARNAADSSVIHALNLPTTVLRQRIRGAADSAFRELMEKMRNAGVPADVAAAAVDDDERVKAEGRPESESFGAYVRAQVESGKRGRELAAALHAEKERRGIGRGDHGRGGQSDNARGGNRPTTRGRDDTTRTTKAPSNNPRRP